ncbi:hypothetical protein EVAR_66700_1 [Eumeta japonica]|uniref:Uncharacterized protein n=1 Tax=Eumeta variegata TaxID=151549 RepID=A0A4C1ZPJ4_EUMVA|nr:hypothetical protein EVAR_66700_1 [Eumeta japonica]
MDTLSRTQIKRLTLNLTHVTPLVPPPPASYTSGQLDWYSTNCNLSAFGAMHSPVFVYILQQSTADQCIGSCQESEKTGDFSLSEIFVIQTSRRPERFV